MIQKLSIKNFQSHADTEIELAPVTVFTGDSDQGKTAILRSIVKLMRNTPLGDFFIRHSQKECIISVELDNGIKVTRIIGKKNNINIYKINDDEYNNFGTTVPDEVKLVLDIDDIQVFDKEKIDFHVSSQHDGLFLINLSESLRGRIFSKLTGSDIVNKALFNLNSLIRSKTKEKENNLSKLDVLNSQIANLSYVYDLENIIDNVNSLQIKVDELHNDIKYINKAYDDINNLSSIINKYENVVEILNSIDTDTLIEKFEMLNKLRDIGNQLHVVISSIKNLKNIENVVVNFDVTNIESIISYILELNNIYSSIVKYKNNINDLEHYVNVDINFNVLHEESLYNDIIVLKNLYDKLSELYKLYKELDTSIKSINNECQELELSFNELKNELKICPICNRPF
jgi:DNA repair exonuclease SbcCD ATPase subunit